MKKTEKQLLETLAKIAKLASSATESDDSATPTDNSSTEAPSAAAPDDAHVGCSIKELPERLRPKAAEMAVRINPVNAPSLTAFNALGPEAAAAVLDPQFLTLLTSKYWGPAPRVLSVSFMETTPADLRARILSHMNAWSTSCGISFRQTTSIGQVRISRAGSGYWSYLGTDVLLIPKSKPTMNLQGFSMSTPESEYRRVVRHETGHTLGFPHEHMRQELISRIDPQKAYAYFLKTQGWNKATVDAQVLTPLKTADIVGTAADQTSIMCYQLPGSITKDGKPIPGGIDINLLDYAFAARVYPKAGAQTAPPSTATASAQQWAPEEDVTDEAVLAEAQATLAASTTDSQVSDTLDTYATSSNGVAAEV
ncbi:M12 family metallopeptidase [Hymenobacter sp. GOD-10R]|uniref:M12 family metallopeptidase n=1 Tax=Hymenobacter sp. GOD-10R TaxID=3093922 RepID=UPI002D79C022|nr:M12 family metallopeptidase [Hymenobacter sp. GOD-10R]WRQ26473.1 M12 family metallopeptidase [Hymenobacter sp. GOD-10R]